MAAGARRKPAAEDDDVSDDDGLVTIRSAHPVPETIDRLVTAVTSRGMTVFARVDHAAGAGPGHRGGRRLRAPIRATAGDCTYQKARERLHGRRFSLLPGPQPRRGSRASRRPSPVRLKASTVSRMHRPGNVARFASRKM